VQRVTRGDGIAATPVRRRHREERIIATPTRRHHDNDITTTTSRQRHSHGSDDMKTTGTTTIALAATLAVGSLLQADARAQDRDQGALRRGELLVRVGGCADCHTPMKMGAKGPERDMARGLSGHPEDLKLPPPPKLDGPWNWAGSASTTAFVGPWGVTYAPNLTPDPDTGIGRWARKDFVQAMRTGRHVGAGRPIMPPMPWQALGTLPERDLHAIFDYLKSRPAVRNRVPDYMPPGAETASAK